MMYIVNTWDIQVQVKVNAKASLVDEQNLSFWQEWKITAVNVHVGDEVKAGDILAELDLKDYTNAIKTTELELENAQFGLSKLLSNDTSVLQAKIRAQIKEAELSLETESDQYSILQKQLETALQQKKDELEETNRTYELAKKELDIVWTGLTTNNWNHAASDLDQAIQDRQQKVNTIVSDLKSILWDAEIVVKAVDKIFGVTNMYTSQAQAYKLYLSTKNTAFKDQTESNVYKWYGFIENFEPKINAISKTSSDNEIYTLIQTLYNESQILVTLSETALDALNTSIEWVDLTETTLEWFLTTVSASRSTAISLRSQLKTLKDSVNSILSNYETKKVSLTSQNNNIDIIKKEITTLEKDNKNQLARKKAQIENLNEQISVLNKELQDAKKWANAYEIKQQKNLISQAELKIERTKNQEEDYQIIAEFSGRVRTVDIVEGEQYKLDDKNYIVVENPNLIELELQVSQIDIVKIKEWQTVTVLFDAYPNTPIQATVTSRNVNPEQNQRWWTYYKTIILLEKQELEILAGMSALVNVNVAEVKNVIIVPTLSLVRQNGKTYVYLRKNDEYMLHEIEIGVSNNFQAEVFSGLQVGDIILASVLDEKNLEKMWITDSAWISISF